MKARSFVAIIALLALLPAAGVLGQGAQTTGAVTGTIVDENGAPIAGAEVTLTGPAIQGERASRTNSAGQFTTRLLPPGQYTAVITAPGYQAAVLTFRVLVGETQGLNVTLYPGMELAEEIVVYGRSTPMESTETRANFDYTTDVEELPIQNRTIDNIAYNAPNTSFGPNAGQVAIAGAPSFDTIVLLDGAEVSDPYFGNAPVVYLEDSIQEVQVLTTGISARYGRFQGGVINAITKSGGNEFSGILRAELSQQSWNSKTPFGEDQADDLNKVYQGTLGGYILRDRLWFFGGYRTIPSTSTSNTTGLTRETFTTTSDEDRFQIKLRGALTPNHTIDASYLEYERSFGDAAGLPAGELLALAPRSDPRDTTSITYQGIFGFNTFVDAIATEKNVSIVSGGDPNGGDPFIDFTTFRVFNNHWWDSSDPTVRDNKTAAVNLSHSLETGFGSHMLQGGVQWVESTTAGDNRQSATGYNLVAFTENFNPRVGPGGDVIFDLLPFESLRWVATELDANNTVRNTAFYIQDSINWNNFRFDLGARYDAYRGTTTGVQTFDLSFNDISPRLGVTYNITPGWQIVGTWGKYVGRFNDSWGENASGVGSAPSEEYIYVGPELLNLNRNEVQSALRNDDFWALIALYGDPNFPTVYVSEDAKSPHAEEFNISLRTALPRNSGFASLTYTQRDFNNLITGFVGLPCTDFGHCEGGDFSAVPGGAFVDSTVWGNDPRTTRDYEGLALQFDYRPTGRVSVGGSWTWSETRGNYEGEATNQPASGSVWGSRERNKPMESAAPYGFLNPHIKHRANAYGTYRFGLGRAGVLSTSGIVNYRTGRVWSRTAAVPVADIEAYADSTGTYTHYFDGRGNNEFPSVWSLDTALRYAVPVIAGVSPFVKLDVRNVLNLDRLLSWQTTGQRRAVNNPNGSFSHWEWAPVGNCGPGDKPSTECTGFGRIANENNYQVPRTFLLSVGLQF